MRNRLFVYLAFASAIAGLTSCQKDALTENKIDAQEHSVVFNVNMDEPATKTGLEITIVPNWKNTKNDDVHMFENHLGYVITGTNCSITTPIEGSYRKAHFTATFAASVETKVSDSYTYNGVVAQMDSEDNFFIPDEQEPDDESLIDPRADFLVGNNGAELDDTQSGKPIDMYFVRPVAISRLAFTNLEGTNVEKVIIYSDDKLTGSTTYNDIDFSEGTAEFGSSTGSKTLTISYGAGKKLDDSVFYAYFVSLAGTKEITKVEVYTTEWKYTKTIGANTSFVANTFNNIACDMTVKDGGKVTKEARTSTATTFYKAVSADDGYSYLIVSNDYALKNNDGTIEAVAVTVANDKIEFEGSTTALLWEAAKNTEYPTRGEFTFVNDNDYIYHSASSSTHSVKTSSSVSGSRTWFVEDNYIYNCTSDNEPYYLYNSSNGNSWKLSTSKSSHTANLYSTRQPQSDFKFNKETATYDMENPSSFVAPTVSGNKTSVSYSSSDETIATVNSSTGAISAVKAGEVKIYAKAAASSTYQGTEIYYTLTVSNSSTTTYKRVSSVTSGKTYIIVNNGGACAFDGSKTDGSKVTVTISNNQITSSELGNCEFTISKSGEYYTFKNSSSKYLTCQTSSSPYYKFSTSVDSDYSNFSLVETSDNLFYFKVKKEGSSSTSKYYLYYNVGDSIWKLGKSGAKGNDDSGVYLYEKQ